MSYRFIKFVTVVIEARINSVQIGNSKIFLTYLFRLLWVVTSLQMFNLSKAFSVLFLLKSQLFLFILQRYENPLDSEIILWNPEKLWALLCFGVKNTDFCIYEHTHLP